MGWYIELTSDRPVAEADIDEILASEIPKSHEYFGKIKQSWGWSHDVDIKISDDGVHLSGSYTQSGQIAKLFAVAFAGCLRLRGYRIKIGEMA